MTLTIRSKTFLSAAVAALPAFFVLGWSASANAQYQIQGGGHALDANPRIGSGGWNGPSNTYSNNGLNNSIVTGNVSGLNYFHDNKSGEFDTHSFAGPTGSSDFDQFNNISSPVNYNQRQTGAPNFAPVYNQGSFVGQPPANYVATPGGTGYIPAPRISPLTPVNDSRLGLIDTDPTRGNLLSPGEMNVAGPVDPSSGSQSIYTMSPLYGVRQDNPADSQDSVFASKTTNSRLLTAGDRAKITPADIQKMRDELNSTIIPANQNNGQPSNNSQPNTSGQPNTNGNTPVTPVQGAVNVSNSQTINNPLTGSATNSAISNEAVNSAVASQQVGGDLNSGQGIQNQLLLPPSKQSKQLKALEEKFNRNKQDKLTDVQATERFNQENLAQKNPTKTFDNTKPDHSAGGSAIARGTGGTGITAPIDAGKTDTGTTAKPDVNTAPAVTPDKSVDVKPAGTANHDYIVTSLATGIDAKGLAQLMRTAEEQMRQGKFNEAVGTYDTAQEVAPNNPFVALGRGFANLGASYYGKADLDISRAIDADPAILAGRYDLKGFLGEDKVKFVHDDLEDIANHEKGARPLVLLSYIAHNSGDDATAARDLDEASKRGGYDQLVKTLRDAWNLK